MNEVMIKWKRLPFLRFLFPFATGIIFCSYLTVPLAIPLAIGLLCFPIIGWLSFNRIQYAYRWIFGLLVFLIWWSIGIGVCWLHDPIIASNHFSKHPGGEETIWYAEIKETKQTDTYQRLLISIRGKKTSSQWESLQGNLLTYLPQEIVVNTGDHIYFKGTIRPIQNSQWPGAFDRYQFWKHRYVRHQISLKEGDFDLSSKGKPTINILTTWRIYFQQQIQDYIEDQQVLGIVTAMVLGDRSLLEEETYDLYVRTGSVHVLAVSGLHVGLVYLVLHFFFRGIPNTRISKGIKALAFIGMIWLYALLTGAAPSVLRAATMFSFVVLGDFLQREGNIFNSLAAAALLLLLWDPYWLFSPGFQLSFLAVAGIAFFQKKIYSLWIPKNKVFDWAWMGISVSIAAQLTTTPISLLYFHQFPSYFWISGLVVIPAAPFILAGGASIILFDPFVPVLANWSAIALTYLVKVLNGVLNWIDQLPNSHWINIPFDPLDCFLAYLLIWCIAGLWQTQKGKWVLFGILCLHIWIGWHTWKDFQASNQHQVFVLSDYQGLILYGIVGDRAYLQASSNFSQSEITQRFQSFHRKHRIQECIWVSPDTTFQHQGIQVEKGIWNIGKKRCWLDLKARKSGSLPIVVDIYVKDHRSKVPPIRFDQGYQHPFQIKDSTLITLPLGHAKLWTID